MSVALGLVVAGSMPAHAAEIIVNGGFDGDNVPAGGIKFYGNGQTIGGGGWTVIGDQDPQNAALNIHTTYMEPGITYNSQAGPNALDLTAGGNTGMNAIEQTIATIAGQAYTLSFYLGNATSNASPLASSVSLQIGDAAAQIFSNALVSPGAVNWLNFTTPFVATGSSTAIRFTNLTPGPDNYAGLDTISVQAVPAVPEPATWMMMILGFGVVGFGLRRRRDQKKVHSRVRFAI